MSRKNSVFEKEYALALKKHRKEGQRVTIAMMESVALQVSRRMLSHSVSGRFNYTKKEVGDFKKAVSELLRGTIESQKSKLVLPANCRYALNSPNSILYVIEHLPQVRTVPVVLRGYAYAYEDCDKEYFRIALPYVVFIIYSTTQRKSKKGNVDVRDTNIACTFRNRPIKSFDDLVYEPYFPNLYLNNHICLGESAARGSLTPTALVDQSIEKFYSSAFTGETEDWREGKAVKSPSSKVKDWKTWQMNTAKNSLFPLKIKWKKGVSLTKLLKGLVGNREVLGNAASLGINNALKDLTARLIRKWI